MGEDEILSLEIRRRIYHQIEEDPGLHLRELARSLDIPLSTLHHHLRFLEDHELVTVRRDGQYKRYFHKNALTTEDKKLLSVLRREKPRRILIELLGQDGEARYGDLEDELEYPSSTLGLYLKELVERDLVDRQPVGRTSIYRVQDEKRLIRLLIEYEESLYDRWIDRVLEIVEETGEPDPDEPPGDEPSSGDREDQT